MVLRASDFDQSKFHKAADVGDIGSNKRVKIKSLTVEEVDRDGRKEKLVCLWFTNTDKGLLLNKTNLRTLSGAYGDVMDKWVEKVIGLTVVMADFRGKAGPAIRIYIPTPKGGDGYRAPAPPPPQSPQHAAPLSVAVAPMQPAQAGPQNVDEAPLDDDFDDEQVLNDDIDHVGR